MRRQQANWGIAVLALLLPFWPQAGNTEERFALVNTIWPTCERAPYFPGTPDGVSWSRSSQLPVDCPPKSFQRANLVGVVALGALQFSNKPQWARGLQRVRREGLRLMSVNAKLTTFYVGVSPKGVAGLHFVGTLAR